MLLTRPATHTEENVRVPVWLWMAMGCWQRHSGRCAATGCAKIGRTVCANDRTLPPSQRQPQRGLSIITSVSLGLKILLTIIGTFTLSIGAVGVVNIMLVSVTERTREIGVLKALGARRRHILLQILIEGLVLTFSGGLLGFVLAALLVKSIGTLPFLGPLFEDTSGRSDIHLAVSVSALLISSTILIVVGLIAEMIPALRASRLDPVQAIRSE
jgi:putative ABC transport system permease protein